MSNLPRALDEHEQYMTAATGYFVDVEKEEKWFLIGSGDYVKTEATHAEMLMWNAWLLTLRANKIAIATIAGRLDGIIGKLEQVKAASSPNSVDPA